MRCTISCYIGLRYNGTRLYVQQFFFQANNDKKSKLCITGHVGLCKGVPWSLCGKKFLIPSSLNCVNVIIHSVLTHVYNNSYPMNACWSLSGFNSVKPRQNGRCFTYDTFKCIFFNENVKIAIKISLKFVSKGPIHNISALVQIMAWRRPGDKPLSEPMMVRSLTHICQRCSQKIKSGRCTKFPGGA